MRNRPVHWHEGMFLRPQHFQAADRHWEEQIAVSSQWDQAYNYGLRSIELSRDALANYQVQLTGCEARLRDGTLVSFAAGQAPDRVDLKECFATESMVTVYLALPKLALGRLPGRAPGCIFRVSAPCARGGRCGKSSAYGRRREAGDGDDAHAVSMSLNHGQEEATDGL